MKKLILDNIKIVVVALFCSLGIGIASAWTTPTNNPPAGNIPAPINTSYSAQLKQGNLWIEGKQSATTAYTVGLIVENGNVGIGTTTPSRKVEIVGDLKVSGSIESQSQSAKPFIYNKNTSSTGKVLTIEPLTAGNVLTINNIDFDINYILGSGSLTNGYVVITYSDGTSITTNITKELANGHLTADFSSINGYHDIVSKMEFYVSGNNLNTTIKVAGYETKL